MNKEYFKILKEIASVESSSNDLKDKMAKEHKRVDFVTEQRDGRLEHIQNLKNKKIELENQLDVIEKDTNDSSKKLERLQMNLHNATTVVEQEGLEKQIINVEEHMKTLNQSIDLAIDEIDSCETQINESLDYEKGSENSLNNLKAEVEKITGEYLVKLDQYSKRIQLLLEEIPENFQQIYLKVSKKNLKYGPFATINGLKCGICSYQLNRVDEVDIQENFKLKTCQSCGRIFIPSQSLY